MDGPPSTNPLSESDEARPAPTVRLASTALLNTINESIYQLDRDGRFVMVNDALTDLTGYDRDALLGSHVSTLFTAEDIVRAETAIREQLLEGSTDRICLTISVTTSSGDPLACDIYVTAVTADGEFRGTAGVMRPVDDAETAATIRNVGERQQAFDALAEASADGIIMLDDESQVCYANPAVERILGWKPEELIGASKMTIIPERLQPVHAEAFQQYLETGEKHIDWTYVELPGQHKDGHEVPLAISINEFTYESEHYFVGTLRDISARKEVEKELETQNERLERFASMLAHELRNPLQVAQIYLDFLYDEDDTATIDEIANALERIDEIIDVLLILAKGHDEIGDREAVGLTSAVAEAWGNIDTGTAEVTVTTSQIVWVNSTHLQQLLENLFRNAIEHSDGNITVRVGALDDGFYVEDTGSGIPDSEREKVVEAGYTTEEGGIGLGLTFVAELADAYGWDYTITDSDEGGARFEFTNVETVADDT